MEDNYYVVKVFHSFNARTRRPVYVYHIYDRNRKESICMTWRPEDAYHITQSLMKDTGIKEFKSFDEFIKQFEE